MAYNTSITISGLINVAGVVVLRADMATSPHAHTPELFEVLGTLARPPSVDAFQEAVFGFINMISDKLPPDMARILLESIMLQPRRSAIMMNTRTHNPERMLQEARAGNLKLLAIGGGRDKTLSVEGFKAILEETGWKEYTYRHMEEADHMPWVSKPDEFRDIVIGWVLSQVS
jgi:pimeloyl-ACP methyl ester carboxylesterase